MRLIDADALLKEVENEQKYLIARGQLSEEHILVHSLKRPVLDAPTVDAVEIVRCKDCVFGCAYNEKWYLPKRNCWWCVKEEKEVATDFYCADGVRRSE